MKMFIPELGTRLVISEDFYFNKDGVDIVLEKGVKILIKKINIKKGRSYSNFVEISVMKCKENKNSIHYGQAYNISIYDFNEMEFELEICDENTKNVVISALNEIQEYCGGMNSDYRKIESIILDSKNIISFSPQKAPSVFFRIVMKKIYEYEFAYRRIMSYEKLNGILNKHFRKNKISELLSN